MTDHNKKHIKEPAWVILAAIAGAYITYVILFSILLGELSFSIGHKAEGLLFMLVFYVVFRIIFRAVYRYKISKIR